MLLHNVMVQFGDVISRRAPNSTSCFSKLPFFGVLPSRRGGDSVPVLLTGRLCCRGFGQPEDWAALERLELESPLAADGFRPPLEDSSCVQMPKTPF